MDKSKNQVALVWATKQTIIVRETIHLSRTANGSPEESREPRASKSVVFDRPMRDWDWHPEDVPVNALLSGKACLKTTVSAKLQERTAKEGAERARVSNARSRRTKGDPLLGDAWTKEGNISVSFPKDGADAYGGGEVAGELCLSGRQFEAWCSDTPFYDQEHSSLYQAHPWLMILMGDGSACGILVDTPYRCAVDASKTKDGTVSFGVPLGDPNQLFPEDAEDWAVHVYRLFSTGPMGVTKALSKLTGRMPMPPRWSLGYQQCRWSYHPAQQALDVAKQFRDRRIPCDVLWFDIHYMDNYRVFTFDPNEFPDPAGTSDSLHELGFRGVWMIDPGVADERDKLDTNAAPAAAHSLTTGIFASGNSVENAWVQSSATDTTPQPGKVWPGAVLFPDFTNDAVCAWWAEQYKPFLALGVDGVWNDMNEPATFDTDSKTLPLTAWHAGAGAPHAAVHNQYGFLMAGASYNGMRQALPDRRPFLLTRSGTVGSQRFAAAWTGDNSSDARHLRYSIPMVLQFGLSGQPFAGPDIGGFFGDAHPKLFARWMGLGTLMPLARGHSAQGTSPHEPWAFGPECEATCRVAISRRYRLLPLLYTLFRNSHQNGTPVVRPLFFADPADQALRKEDSGFLIGHDLLVATPPNFFSDTVLDEEERDALEAKGLASRQESAKTSPEGVFDETAPLAVDVSTPCRIVPPKIDRATLRDADGTPLPGGPDNWLLLDDILHDGIDIDGACLEDLPHVYMRRGSCVPLGMVVPSVAYLAPDEVVVDVVVALAAQPGADAIGVVYEDDGDGYEHQKSGRYRETTYFAQVQESVERVVVQRRVTGGGADYGRFAQVRILCCVGNGPVAIGIINPGDDTLHMMMPTQHDENGVDMAPLDMEDGSYEDLETMSPGETWLDEEEDGEEEEGPN